MKKIREYIDRILGNSIRCLLPSYWWKKLFHAVVDEIDDVRSTANSKATKSEVVSLSNSVDELAERIEGVIIPKIKFYVPLLGIGSLTDEQKTRNSTSSIILRGTFDRDYIIEVLGVGGVSGDKYYPSIPVWVYKQTDGRIRIAIKDDISTFDDDIGRIIWDHLVYTIETDGSVSCKSYGLRKVVESYVDSGTLPHDIVIPSSLTTYNEYKAKLAEYGLTEGNTYHVGFQYEGKGIGFKISVGVGSNDIHLWWIDEFGDFWRTTINKYEYFQTVVDETSHGGTIYIGHELTDELKGMNVKFFRGGIGSDSRLSSNNPLNIGVKVRYYDADKLSVSTYQILSFEVDTSVTDNILRWRFTILRNGNLETWRINAVDGSCTCEKVVNVIDLTEEIVNNELVTAAALNDLNDRIKKLEEQLKNAGL